MACRKGARVTQAGGRSDAILVLGFRALGDFVRCHSAIQLIAQANPGRPIDVLTSPVGARVAAYMPGVRDAIAIGERHGRLGLLERWRAIRAVRARRYRSAYVLPGTYKSALVPFLAGIPERIGYPDEFRFGLVNRFPKGWFDRYVKRGTVRMVDFICTASARGLPALPDQWPEPVLQVPAEVLAAWKHEHRANEARPMLTLYTSSFSDRRSWPVERFAAVAEKYVQAGWTVWVSGGVREAPFASELCHRVPGVVDYTRTPLEDALCQLASSDLFLGIDAGLSHAAAAFGIPCVVVYSVNAVRFAPINGQAVVLTPPLGMTPGRRGTAGISVERVLSALEAAAPSGDWAQTAEVAA